MVNIEIPCGVVVLAAGLGKRMHSSIPKVLHEVAGQPIIVHLLKRIGEALPKARVALVLGHGAEQVKTVIANNGELQHLQLTFILQKEQLGTGHAVRCAIQSEWGQGIVKEKLPVLVLPGDTPLLTAGLISEMSSPLSNNKALRLLTAQTTDPFGYGRVVRRGKSGPVLRITEEKDASLREKGINEVALSIYFFQAQFLKAGLERLSNKNAQKEYYLTDLVSQASRLKKKIDAVKWPNIDDVRGINDRWELAIATRILNERCIKKWAKEGVTFVDPYTTHVEDTVILEPDVTISAGVTLSGTTKIERGTLIGPNVVLKDVKVGPDANIKVGTVAEKSIISAKAQVGPYAHFRPDSFVGEKAKIGNFVELKKARIGANTNVAHLSYVGDAEIGERVNIGCGFITCNFDGRIIDGQRKHRTVIEDDVFMGSDCQVIAPIKIGKGAYVASGSTVTEDVEAGSLAIARSRQVNKPGYARKLKGQD